MLFVTEQFLIFFLAVYLLFWAIPVSFRMTFLMFASLFFYASWSPLFALHFLLMILVNYFVMEIWRKRRWNWLFFILQAVNILNISFFKYFYFFADVVGALLGSEYLRYPNLLQSHRISGHEIFLPLAISFYTFQIMAYGIDIFRGSYNRSHSLRDVILFKSFFPQLIAGPIMRSNELLPQISDYGKTGAELPNHNTMKKGLWYVLIGAVKKLFIADQLVGVIMPLFSSPVSEIGNYSPLSLWLIMFCSFTFLYADFSAYSDLARGFGYLLGFEIPINFRAPLFSHSISEFWRRWHLTFSLWIRDYIFIPLGGSRVSEWKIYANLTFTFFLGGLWHGASYAFVIWGALTGVALSLESFMIRRGVAEWPSSWPARIARIGFSWMIMLVGAAFFFCPTAETLGTTDSFDTVRWSATVISRMFYIPDYFLADPFRMLLDKSEIILSSLIGLILFSSVEQWPHYFSRLRRYENWLLPVIGLVVILAAVEFAGGQKDFFYFQF